MIRKFLIISLFLILMLPACTQQTVYIDEAVLEWDTVIAYEDGSPFLPTDIIEYEVYRSTVTIADRNLPDVFVGLTSTNLLSVSIPNDGQKHAYAVRTKVTTDEGNTVLYSASYNWSDITEPGETTDPFVVQHKTTKKPGMPLHLRLGGM